MTKRIYYTGLFSILVMIAIIYGVIKYVPKNKGNDTQTNETEIERAQTAKQTEQENNKEESITETKYSENTDNKAVELSDVEAKINDNSVSFDIAGMSEEELKKYIEKVISENDIHIKKALFQRISLENYPNTDLLLFHLETNIAENCRKTMLKASYYSLAIGTCRDLLRNNSYRIEEEKIINTAEALFDNVVHIIKDNPWQDEFKYSWLNAYTSLERVYYCKDKDIDYSMELVDRYNKIISVINPPNAEEICMDIKANIAYSIAAKIIYERNREDIIVSENSINNLKEYAHSLSDDQGVPVVPPQMKKLYLKSYIMKALDVYKESCK